MAKHIIVALVAALLMAFGSAEARADGGAPARVLISLKDGKSISSMTMPKGSAATLVATALDADGKPATGEIRWSTDNAAAVDVQPSPDGAQVKALRDVFDEPSRREPIAHVTACVGAACAVIPVLCAVDVVGHWNTHLNFLLLIIPHTEERNLVFRQEGRIVRFLVDGEEQVIVLDGTRIRLLKGSVLTKFDGALTDRGRASGSFSSRQGFSGDWTAIRSP